MICPVSSSSSCGELVSAFRTLGFKFITLDLEGFRSGSLNSVIPAEDLLRGVRLDKLQAASHEQASHPEEKHLLTQCRTPEAINLWQLPE